MTSASSDAPAARRRDEREALVSSGRLTTPESLPISAARDELLEAIGKHQVVVVAGETGSGKSTQLPKLCLELGRGVAGLIGHTQPRRVAARTIAERVAAELGTTVGGAVGYTVRFNDRVGDDTLVRVMTDGILLAELQRDRELRRYDTLIIDEAHERNLNVDFICGYLRRLLPRRPDLKVIITSATIDTERFAAHFGSGDDPAPVVTVSGRSYPVEMLYRPLAERDQVQGILDAVDELATLTANGGAGDVLVFLSGEREIHDTADALRHHETRGRGLEVLPLYARLSSAEQHRIFTPGRSPKRRVVLSTNIAETSVTVPGIRYVVDAGTARVSRYSRRLKVQRLPIEPISQAAANQRAGRCGRVAPGVCIRLYDEDDFAARPEFTDPEILRTNLASVILQMTAIGLGDVAAFPFVEPPDTGQIRDGYRLLEELGAIDDSTGDPQRDGGPPRLTKIGRRLARLPIDPRLGRMVIEAERLGCVREVLVIAAALSIRDPRERPSDGQAQADKQAQADELHRRFDVEGSDLLTIVALWDYLREQQRKLSSNQFRRLCRREYLNYLRVREWHDLFSQLRRAAGEVGIRPGSVSSHPDHVHQAVLAGLLSHLGHHHRERREYRGARGSSFLIAPGSVHSKGAARRKPPAWVMAAELVETNRLWARRVVAVQPEWAEQLGAHLVRRSYGEPRWDARSGRAVTTETVTLYGLPVVEGRTVGYDRVDKAVARDLFIRNALVAGDTGPQAPQHHFAAHDFVEHNRRFAADVAALEDRLRRRDLLDEEALVRFYDARIPADVVSTRHFDRWWKDVDDPTLLELSPADLAAIAGEEIDFDDYPDTITLDHGTADYGTVEGDVGAVDDMSGQRLTLDLTYRYAPGEPLDGVTVHVPLVALNQVRGVGFDWLVDGYRRELVERLARTLSKATRRRLIPLADTVDAAARRVRELSAERSSEPFTAALADVLTEVSEVRVTADDFDPGVLPDHLRMHIVVSDGDGTVYDAGDDLEPIKVRLAATSRTAIAAAIVTSGAIAERAGLIDWDLGRLPRTVAATTDGVPVLAYPALVDRGESVSLRIVTTADLQAAVMSNGVRRLLLLTAAPSLGAAARRLDQQRRLAIAGSRIALGELADDCRTAAVGAVLGDHELPWDREAFDTVRADVRRRAPAIAERLLATAADVVSAATAARTRLESLRADALAPSIADASEHLDRLVAAGFVTSAGAARLGDVERYVRGIGHRIERIGGDVPRDLRRMAEVRPLEARLATALARRGRATPNPELTEIGWLLEELRISLFAQHLAARKGSTGGVSLRRLADRLTAAGA